MFVVHVCVSVHVCACIMCVCVGGCVRARVMGRFMCMRSVHVRIHVYAWKDAVVVCGICMCVCLCNMHIRNQMSILIVICNIIMYVCMYIFTHFFICFYKYSQVFWYLWKLFDNALLFLL